MHSILRHTALAASFVATVLGGPVRADDPSGAYLAGRHAIYSSDFAAAAQYFSRALIRDPSNPDMMANVVQAHLSLGQVDKAVPVAELMRAQGLKNQVANMVLTGHAAVQGEFSALVAQDPEMTAIGPLVDGLVTAWAHLGAGDVPPALAAFDKVVEQNGLRSFGLYHKALALAMMGDFEAAQDIFADPEAGPMLGTRRGVLAQAEVLSQLGRNEDALEMLAEAFTGGFDPALIDMADRLAAGETLPFSHVTKARDGISEVFFTVGIWLNGEAANDYALLYARMASYLRPDHIEALLLSAELLDGLRQFDLASAAYKQVPAGSPESHAAELGRAESLRRAAKPDAAIEVLEQLAADYPGLPGVHTALGDLYRQQEKYAQAIVAYDRSLEYTEDGVASRWFVLYARGISQERLANWPAAEADFRAALELNPDQPQVLNYLGYSLVEKQTNLDEALAMIERAVAARPDSGYIVDSLGWVLYRLGRYEEAVGHMERAVALMPVDPVVNDHLGDVYWAVGRVREADFQWSRALSFIDPEDTDGEADPERIRRKLEVGLDQVLTEEGAPPLTVADDAD